MCWAAAASNILYWAGYYTPTLNTANLLWDGAKTVPLPALPCRARVNKLTHPAGGSREIAPLGLPALPPKTLRPG